MSTRRAVFVNLTAGLAAIPDLQLDQINFIRIQSTACEQKRWDFLIADLDHNLLMKLALGVNCVVYDYGARKPIPRAIWQGLSFVKYVLVRRWDKRQPESWHISRGGPNYINVASDFEKWYRELSAASIAKIDYYRQFYCGVVNLEQCTAEISRATDDIAKEFLQSAKRQTQTMKLESIESENVDVALTTILSGETS